MSEQTSKTEQVTPEAFSLTSEYVYWGRLAVPAVAGSSDGAIPWQSGFSLVFHVVGERDEAALENIGQLLGVLYRRGVTDPRVLSMVLEAQGHREIPDRHSSPSAGAAPANGGDAHEG